MLNTWGPRQNGRHFADDIFKCIFLNGDIWMSMNISLKFVPKGHISDIPALIQIMAWRRPGDKPLSEPKLFNLTDACIYASLGLNELKNLMYVYCSYLITFATIFCFSCFICSMFYRNVHDMAIDTIYGIVLVIVCHLFNSTKPLPHPILVSHHLASLRRNFCETIMKIGTISVHKSNLKIQSMKFVLHCAGVPRHKSGLSEPYCPLLVTTRFSWRASGNGTCTCP